MKIEAEEKSNIVYIDESGIKNTLRNEYAWSPRGESVNDERKGRATEKLNIIAGLSDRNIIAPMIYECGTNSELFNFWLEHSLLPEIPKDSLVVMDNASFHKSKKQRSLWKNFLADCSSCRLIPLI